MVGELVTFVGLVGISTLLLRKQALKRQRARAARAEYTPPPVRYVPRETGRVRVERAPKRRDDDDLLTTVASMNSYSYDSTPATSSFDSAFSGGESGGGGGGASWSCDNGGSYDSGGGFSDGGGSCGGGE
jgi:hypothetical protein